MAIRQRDFICKALRVQANATVLLGSDLGE